MSIKINKLQCPNCGANLEAEAGRDVTFCSYCGTKMILTDENLHKYKHEYSYTSRSIDETEIERIRAEERKERRSNLSLVIMVLGYLILGIIAVLLTRNM